MFVLSPRKLRKNPINSSRPWIQQTRKTRATSDRNNWLESERKTNSSALCLHDFLEVTERKNLHNEAMRLVDMAVEQEQNHVLEHQKK